MNKILPKIIFKQMPLKLETEMFFDFFASDWSGMITKKYPEFTDITKIKSKKEKLKAIRIEICRIRAERNKELDNALKNIKSNWQKVEVQALETLAYITQTDWPKKTITAYISLNPICPRYLDSWSFAINYDRKNPNMIIAHEISHFLFFKKFQEIFPKISRKNYESPHKEWFLSELTAPTVLNDSRMTKIFGKEGNGFYDEHKKLKIGGKLVTKIISDLYRELVIDKKDFSEYINRGLNIVNSIN